MALNSSFDTGRHFALQLAAYVRTFGQGTDNGNRTSYVACQAGAFTEFLCQESGTTPVMDASGTPLPDLSDKGSVPLGENDRQHIDSRGRGLTLQLSSSRALAGWANRLLAGASVDEARVDFRSNVEVGVLGGALVVLPSGLFVTTVEGAPFNATPVDLHSSHTYYGLYATDTLDIAPGLVLTVSGRYNIAEIHLRDRRGSALTGDSRYTHFNPALGFSYRLRPSVTAYLQATRNARTPTASEIECSDPTRPCVLPSSLSADPPTLRQVVAHTLEGGLRGRSGPDMGAVRWSWSAGLFRTRVADDIYGIAASASTGYFSNIGVTRRQGAELDVQFAAGRWTASASYAYLEATFESSLLLS